MIFPFLKKENRMIFESFEIKDPFDESWRKYEDDVVTTVSFTYVQKSKLAYSCLYIVP